MITKAQKFRFGLFILIGSILIIILFSLVLGSQLTKKQDDYIIEFKNESVNGLQLGGGVKYHGIKIGTVRNISVGKDDIEKIVVEISVNEGTPIKEDVKATLAMVGITGLMQIELIGGTNEAKNIQPGGKISVGKSLMSNISGKAESIANKTEKILEDINDFLSDENKDNLSQILKNVNLILENNRDNINSTISNIESISNNLDNVSLEAEKSIVQLNNFLESDELKILLANSSEFSQKLNRVKLDSLSQKINSSIENFDLLIRDVDYTVLKSREDIFDSVEYMKETMDNLREFSRIISENPSSIIRSQK